MLYFLLDRAPLSGDRSAQLVFRKRDRRPASDRPVNALAPLGHVFLLDETANPLFV